MSKPPEQEEGSLVRGHPLKLADEPSDFIFFGDLIATFRACKLVQRALQDQVDKAELKMSVCVEAG